MNTRFKIEKPGDVEFTMSITMTADGWEKLRDQLDKSSLSQSYPAWSLRAQINDVLAQARKIYWAKEAEAPKSE